MSDCLAQKEDSDVAFVQLDVLSWDASGEVVFAECLCSKTTVTEPVDFEGLDPLALVLPLEAEKEDVHPCEASRRISVVHGRVSWVFETGLECLAEVA